ncbi:MAG: hypothetical protein FGM46_06600 [Ferruginibacter sp.]|nr:hypothetical protein [Ferruginibacter sp.]
MSRFIRYSFILFSFFSISVFESCTEKGYIITNETPFIDQSEDHSTFTKETDEVFNDVNAAIEIFSAFRGRINSPLRVICEASAVLDSTATERRITITYDGRNCSGTRNRYGEVVLTMPLSQKWTNAGALLTVNIKNLIITRLRDNQKFILNGIHTIKNVTGGSVKDLSTIGTVVHEIKSTAGMTLDFSNNARRLWYVYKKRTFTYDNGIVISTVGMHNDGTISGISEWGTTRAGTFFSTVIEKPMVIKQSCDYRLVSGEVSHRNLIGTLNVLFGLDGAGNPTSCPGTSALYYFKLTYTNPSGDSKIFITPY